MSTQKSLSIIIVNHNGRFWLKQTLETLKKQYLSNSQLNVKTIVVDNNSTDDSQKMIRQSFRWVELLTLDENVGFAAGNNVALRNLTTDYALLLNSDMELHEHSNFDQLIEVLEENKNIGIISPKVKLTNAEIDPACHRGEPTLWASFTYFLGLESLFPNSKLFGQYHQYYKNIETIHEIDACSGAAMMVRAKALKKVGLLDERFFMYAEDLDWCKRFRDEGLSILYYPLVVVTHHKNKSGIESHKATLSHRTKHHFYDTMLQYFDKHYAHHYPKWIRSLIAAILHIKKGVL